MLESRLARLVDYAGLWSLEPTAFAQLKAFAEGLDMHKHLAADRQPLAAVMEMTSVPNGKSIATVQLTGLLMKGQSSLGGTSTIDARRQLRAAMNNPNVAAILLAIDSPGGSVAGTDDLTRDVSAAARVKPVWAAIEDLGCSAAYWPASQAHRITANSRTALVGSIGTYQVVYDESAAAEKAGIRTLVFATGSLKGLGTPGSPLTEEQATHLQGLVSSVQESFDRAVQSGRGLTDAQLAAVRHGGALTAPAALDAKLIDGIQPLGDTMAELIDVAKRSGGGARASTGALPMLTHSGLPMLERPRHRLPRLW